MRCISVSCIGVFDLNYIYVDIFGKDIGKLNFCFVVVTLYYEGNIWGWF